MKVFTCRHRVDDMLTCIYRAWEAGIKFGHENIYLMVEPVYQISLFDEYEHIEAEPELVKKVIRSICQKISTDAYVSVYYACLSEGDELDTIYRFLQLGFRKGSGVVGILTEPAVTRMMEIRRMVGNEIHSFVEFARFDSIDGKVYVCHLEPKNRVLYQVAEHFADRMPMESFMMIDDRRQYAVIHNGRYVPVEDKVPAQEGMTELQAVKQEQLYERELSIEEMQVLKQTEEYPDEYRKLWKTFFDTIAIEQRENRKCQMNHIPLWKRKHAVEFK